MFGPTMEEQVLLNLEPKADPSMQQQALQYLDQVKNTELGWRFAMDVLTAPESKDDRLRFFCLQILECFVRHYYGERNAPEKLRMHTFLINWLQLQVSNTNPAFILNKAAQIYALVFVQDYPIYWSNFLTDLIETLTSVSAVDLYLRILSAINLEIADKEVLRTAQETERNSSIKNVMRQFAVKQMVESWYFILETYRYSDPELCSHCMDVIGPFIAWIDITLVANERFLSMLVSLKHGLQTRVSAVNCLLHMVNKGMSPADKVQLIENLFPTFQEYNLATPLKDDESEFTMEVSKLLNGMGLNLIDSYKKVCQMDQPDQAAKLTEIIELLGVAMINYLRNDYDDVSLATMEFAREYVHLLKGQPKLSEYQMYQTHTLLLTVIHKVKYDDTYNFEQQGEDEVTFLEYRKQIKVLFDNVAPICKSLTIQVVQNYTTRVLSDWQNNPFQDVEVAIYLLYLLAESLPAADGNHFIGDMVQVNALKVMMRLLVTCGVNHHQHVIVKLQYMETVVRYAKFFEEECEYVQDVLRFFLDYRCMRNPNPSVRSRGAYLFTRFIKALKTSVMPYVKEVFPLLVGLLELQNPVNEMSNEWIDDDDQLYLYEAAGLLIMYGPYTDQEKGRWFSELLTPVVEKFRQLLDLLSVEPDKKKQEKLTQAMCHAMAVTSRASKVFNGNMHPKSYNCTGILTEALTTYLKCLELPHGQEMLQNAVRQFLHRMVVCLEEDLLPIIPQASEGLLKAHDIRSIQEYVPLIVQIISKFKKEIIPVLHQLFRPIVCAIFATLSRPIEDNDEQAKRDYQFLMRNYLQFISAIVANNVTEVLQMQDTQFLEQILLGITECAVSYPDSLAEKICFQILGKLISQWGRDHNINGFQVYLYNYVLPTCILAPMKPSFDFNDPNCKMALVDSAMCLRGIFEKQGPEFLTFLRLECLPNFQFPPERIEEFCGYFSMDVKNYKKCVQAFFQQARTNS